MNICQSHWDKLKAALKDRGLENFGAKTGEDAIRVLVTEIEGRSAENDFNPLLACNNMIWSKGLELMGFAAMNGCPICESVKAHEEWWISGPADAMLQEAIDLGLVKPKE